MKLPPLGTYELLIMTAVITAVITILTTLLFKKLGKTIILPFFYIKEFVYKWIAPRNPFSISVRSYKKHVMRSGLAKIENPVGPKDLKVPLEQAYAPLKLISEENQDRIELFSHIANCDRHLILGGPGTGKTTLMKSLMVNIINQTTDKKLDNLIPVFVVLRELAKNQHTIEDSITSAFKDYHFPGAQKFVNSALDQGKMLIILDGLDEVGINREFVTSQIRAFCKYDEQRVHKNTLVVTCRENSYQNEYLRDVISNVVRVEPFANDHMRHFLQGWPLHNGRSAIELYGIIQRDPIIRDVCRNPLLLTILTGLYLAESKFQLPTSRTKFYQESIDELLINRPSRREIKQVFESDDKIKILEGVSLERLETVKTDEDPEEITLEAIYRHADKVLHYAYEKKKLIEELTETNSIIKLSGEEKYTYAHRTIQEFFAAREARINCKIDEVVDLFGKREDLIEVLYFYCGFVDNKPQLDSILEKLVVSGKWVVAGNCILNMTMIPQKNIIEEITNELFNIVKSNTNFVQALEILSSFAQRTDAAFSFGRDKFSEAIDLLTKQESGSGASALESVLSASPEVAMKIIPGLLRHKSPRWKKASVQLLRDIGTDESLDTLVSLLQNDDELIKAEAGKTLADLIKTRKDDLLSRKEFLPQRKDMKIWPLEKYFPGCLAIPIAEAVANFGKTSNKAINCAIDKITASSSDKQKTLKQWENLPNHLNIRRYKKRTGIALGFGGTLSLFLITTIIVITGFWCLLNNKFVIFSFYPLKVNIENNETLTDLSLVAKNIVSELKGQLPPNASGVSRILPWNWKVEPLIPIQTKNAFKILRNYSKNRVNPYKLIKEQKTLSSLSYIMAVERIDILHKAINAVITKFQNTNKNHYLFFEKHYIYYILNTLFLLMLLLSQISFVFTVGRKDIPQINQNFFSLMNIIFFPFQKIIRNNERYLDFAIPCRMHYSGLLLVCLAFIFDTISISKVFIFILSITVLPILIGIILLIINLPRNSLIPVIDDILSKNETP